MKAGMRQGKEAWVGLTLAAGIILAWLSLHILLMSMSLAGLPAPIKIALAALVCWLSVGLFIVAHDAIHGTLALRHPRLNRLVGALALRLYAGFDFTTVAAKHRLHHAHAGGDGDPDFHRGAARGWQWYLAFMREYVSVPQIAFMAIWVTGYAAILGVEIWRMALYWIAPLLLSTVQLFVFGTNLPHRPAHGEVFVDDHRARSLDLGWLPSLLACFHFGYHHEHHAHPTVPWWRLPQLRKRSRG